MSRIRIFVHVYEANFLLDSIFGKQFAHDCKAFLKRSPAIGCHQVNLFAFGSIGGKERTDRRADISSPNRGCYDESII